MATSNLEQTFAFYWNVLAKGAPEPETEHRFDATRRWRFDFAWPGKRVAVEIEGGTYANGRHNRAAGYAKDCEKYNAAIEAGWRVLRYTGDMLANDPESVIFQVKRLVCE